MRKVVILSLLAAAAVPFAAAGAEPPALVHGHGSAPTARVAYGDLNLASAEGLATLERRLRRAAEGLCGSPWVQSVGEASARRACARQTIAEAQPQVRRLLAGQGTARYAAQASLTIARAR